MDAQSTSELTSGITEFSLDLYKLFTDGDENMFMSPYSVAACLLLADLGANGNTEEQIRHALGVRGLEKDAVHKLYQQLQERLNAETKGTTTLAVANRLFAKLGLKVDAKYIKDSKQFYGSELQQLDFGEDPEGSRQTINKWVEEQTRNKIKDLVPPEGINPMSLMVLVNAIYFKGSWDETFHANKTSKTKFRVSNDDHKMVDMMNDTRDCNYLKDEKLRLSAVSLPYQSKNLSMIFILPDEIDGLSKLESTLTGGALASLCRDVVQGGRPEVILGIPKFKMEATYDLTSALPRLGIKDMFGAADFSAMLPANPDAYVSAIIHKAFVENHRTGEGDRFTRFFDRSIWIARATEFVDKTKRGIPRLAGFPRFVGVYPGEIPRLVNEEGTEAAAATAMMFECFSMPAPPERFILDHPFMFLIWNHASSTVLFMGRYVKPPN